MSGHFETLRINEAFTTQALEIFLVAPSMGQLFFSSW